MKNIDNSIVTSVAVILVIQFVLSRILVIPVLITSINIYAFKDSGLIFNIISDNIVFTVALLLSLLIVIIIQKQFDKKNILKISTFVTLIILEFAIIKFFIDKNTYNTIQLLIEPTLVFVVTYGLLKIYTKNSKTSKNIMISLTIFAVSIIPILFVIFYIYTIIQELF